MWIGHRSGDHRLLRLFSGAEMTRSHWAVISSYGSRIRTAGEQLELCDMPLDDFHTEVEIIESACRKIKEQLRIVQDLPPLEPSMRVNWEMLESALDKVTDATTGEIDRDELKKEIFG